MLTLRRRDGRGRAPSLRGRLWSLIATLVIPAIAAGGLLVHQTYEAQRKLAEVTLLETAQALSLVVDREFKQAETLLRTLASSTSLQSGDFAGFEREMRTADALGGWLVLTDAGRHELINTRLPAGSPLPQATVGVPAHTGISISDLVVGDNSRQPIIHLVLPVRLASGQTDALALVLPATVLRRILLEQGLPAQWIGSVLDASAHVVARVPESGFAGRMASTAVRRAVAGAREGTLDLVSREGKPALLAYARSTQTGWTVALAIPRYRIAEAARRSLLILGLIGTGLLIAAAAGVRAVTRAIVVPMEALTRAAARVGAGELPPVPGGLREVDEVAAALRAANHALRARTEALSELNETLGARVEERTAALARANRELAEQREQLGTILDNLPAGVMVARPDHSVLYYNPELIRLLGLPTTATAAEVAVAVAPESGGFMLGAAAHPLDLALSSVVTDRQPVLYRDASGGERHLEVSAGPVRDRAGRIVLAVLAMNDISARLEAQEALRRAQRLEAVGQLTGGVAHEFNNLLMAITGCLELLAIQIPTGRGRELLDGAMRAAQRGARLTTQLLAFSRKQHLQLQTVDLNALVLGMTELLRSTLGRSIEVRTALEPDVWSTVADPAQLELVILNLAINARDALDGAGTVTIGTANVLLSTPSYPEDPPAGEYAVLSVADTGSGMRPDVLARAFEPFFTTKDVGKGSGLGLPQVLGVAQQLGGGVRITSKAGAGTRVAVFLPRAAGAVEADPTGFAEPLPTFAVPPLPNLAILLVDDDEDVREVAAGMLRELGARVGSAASGGEALERMSGVHFDLVLLDYLLPGLSGIEIATQIHAERPELPIILMTGFSAGELALEGTGIVALLHKPFSAHDLAAAIARATAAVTDAIDAGETTPPAHLSRRPRAPRLEP